MPTVLYTHLSSVALPLPSGTLQPGTHGLSWPLTLGSLHSSWSNEETPPWEVGEAEGILPRHPGTEGPLEIPLGIGGPQSPHPGSASPMWSPPSPRTAASTALLSSHCPSTQWWFFSLWNAPALYSGAKARSAILCLWHLWSHRCLTGIQGREWVKIPLFLSHLSNFLTLATYLGSQGHLWSLSYEKLVGCCLITRGNPQPPSHAAFSPLAGFTLSSPDSWALFLGSVAGRKGCLFSLS